MSSTSIHIEPDLIITPKYDQAKSAMWLELVIFGQGEDVTFFNLTADQAEQLGYDILDTVTAFEVKQREKESEVHVYPS